ncbi:MAG TPA: uroporphyrinogen decarboxylase family protein [Acidobacteriaceae bacterium]|nr:uroporphyrinogen decarboxylase family protein [Acidobacteriaceae bacterium]
MLHALGYDEHLARPNRHRTIAKINPQLAAGRPGHIFNLGHGIVPNTPVDSVLRVVDLIKRHAHTTPHAPNEATSDWAIRA